MLFVKYYIKKFFIIEIKINGYYILYYYYLNFIIIFFLVFFFLFFLVMEICFRDFKGKFML